VKIETKMKRIMDSDIEDWFKAVQLDSLALCCMPGSPIQKDVLSKSSALKLQCGGHKAVYDIYLSRIGKS